MRLIYIRLAVVCVGKQIWQNWIRCDSEQRRLLAGNAKVSLLLNMKEKNNILYIIGVGSAMKMKHDIDIHTAFAQLLEDHYRFNGFHLKSNANILYSPTLSINTYLN